MKFRILLAEVKKREIHHEELSVQKQGVLRTMVMVIWCNYSEIKVISIRIRTKLSFFSCSSVSEPDPNHTLEERVVHWYFKQLDKNSSGDIGKKEIKPFKRFLRKKSKPKKCVKKFVEYCDVNNDKSLSVQELMGCLGVTKEEGKAETKKRHSKNLFSLSFPLNSSKLMKSDICMCQTYTK